VKDTTEPDLDDQVEEPEADDRPDLLSLLTIDELNAGSRVLKASLVAAVTEKTQDYERGLAVTLYLHERRRDPKAKLAPLFALSFTEISERLTELADQLAKEAAPLGPTTS
jgi:hypothetical protein